MVATTPASTERDVLAELDSVGEHLHGLMGEEDLPGRHSNRLQFTGVLKDLRQIAENIVNLEKEYASGVTHKQRLEKSMGSELSSAQVAHLGVEPDLSVDKARIAELEAQLKALKGA